MDGVVDVTFQVTDAMGAVGAVEREVHVGTTFACSSGVLSCGDEVPSGLGRGRSHDWCVESRAFREHEEVTIALQSERTGLWLETAPPGSYGADGIRELFEGFGPPGATTLVVNETSRPSRTDLQDVPLSVVVKSLLTEQYTLSVVCGAGS